MKLTITIEMDNDAFLPLHGAEAARILRKIAKRIDNESCSIGDVTPCIDLNGNKVGKAIVSE